MLFLTAMSNDESKRSLSGLTGCCSVWNSDTEVLHLAGANLSFKNPGNISDLSTFLSPTPWRNFFNSISQWSNPNQRKKLYSCKENMVFDGEFCLNFVKYQIKY